MGRSGDDDIRTLARKYRQAAGLTQRQLADSAGVSVGVIRDMEQGRTTHLHARSADAVVSALGLDGRSARQFTRAASGAPAAAGPDEADGLFLSVLGPVSARRGTTELQLGPPSQRAVLALLALSSGELVSRETLVDALWGEAPPASAVEQVQKYAGKLRRILDPGSPGQDPRGLLVSAGTGYRLRVGLARLDLLMFRDLADRGQSARTAGDDDTACALLEQACALWHGDPAADVSVLQGHPAVTGLAWERITAMIACAQTACAAGWYERALPHLIWVTRREPLHEQAHALLMVALAGSGQQAAALREFEELRRRLDEQLGARPCAELADAHQRVLHGDIRAARRGPLTGAPVPAPRQLPGMAADFTGRAAELATLDGMLEGVGDRRPGTLVISAIGGTAGVGKTALAVHWAHQAAGRFPDGQLYVNLRGFAPSASPVPPSEAIRGFLGALGVPAERVPSDLAAQVGLYRSLLAYRKILIVLDNARDEEQVRPLLPSGPGCLAIVTSRNQLTGLAAAEGARLFTLDVLTHDEACRMLAARLGGARADDDPDAVAQIAGLCARLPLALAIVAAGAAARPLLPVAALAAELRGAASPLDALETGDPATSIRAVFSWSYSQLSPTASRMFRLLGLHFGPDIGAPAAASLAGIGGPAARRLLAELARAHLITEHTAGRYAFHDLLRAFAAGQARATDSDIDRGAAIHRMLDHYLHTAHAAALLIDSTRDPIPVQAPRPGLRPEPLAGYQHALAWLRAEHQVLLAAITLADSAGFDVHAWQIPCTMNDFLHRSGQFQQIAAISRIAATAAARLGEAAGQAASLRNLSLACMGLGDYDQALVHCAVALGLCQQSGDRVGEAKVHQFLAVIARDQDRYADGLSHDEQALRLYQDVGHRTGESSVLNNLGWAHILLGDYDKARVLCRQSLVLTAELGLRHGQGHAWDSLGYVEHHLAHFAEAAACYERALTVFRDIGDLPAQAETLTHLGDSRHAGGDQARAADAWQQALNILADLGHAEAETIRRKLRLLALPDSAADLP